jgi:hypothetical protein
MRLFGTDLVLLHPPSVAVELALREARLLLTRRLPLYFSRRPA